VSLLLLVGAWWWPTMAGAAAKDCSCSQGYRGWAAASNLCLIPDDADDADADADDEVTGHQVYLQTKLPARLAAQRH
jgi:hypothetical protein